MCAKTPVSYKIIFNNKKNLNYRIIGIKARLTEEDHLAWWMDIWDETNCPMGTLGDVLLRVGGV